MFHQKSSNSTYRNIGWKKVVLCCSVSGLALFAAETAEAACNTTGTFTRTNCFSNGNIQYFSDEGASSLTLTGETASSVELKPDDSVTGATTQTLTIDGNTTLTRTDYSAVISQTNKANRNAIAVIETGATISTSGGGFGAIWFKNDTSGDISITSGAMINSTGQQSGAAGISAVTNGGNVYITNEASGKITSDDRGLYADGGSQTVKTAPYTVSITNHGTVNATTYSVLDINKTIGTGFGARVNNYYGNAAITNTGTITATDRQGVVTWSADGGSSSINNSGKIEAGDDIAVQAWSTNGDAIVTNSGTVIASDDPGRSDPGAGFIGIQTQVETSGNTTITNTTSGTVTASADTGIEAKALTAGNITISNAGTVSSLRGIYAETASGTINISNSGTISATQYAIKTTGTTQSLVNSGTIKGNIENTSATGLTISNDNSTIYGVLSGYTSDSSMVKGQITHTNADLTFSSGKIWLNDDINATGHSVNNTGATLKLSNAVTITGNYVQTGGGLLVEAANTSSHGALNVSGDAAISNSTVVVSGNNLAVGDSYTIVGAGGTGSYTTLSASVVGTADRNAVVKTVGKDLVVILTKADGTGKYTPVGNAEGGSATPLGRTLDTINAKDTPAAIAFQNQVLAQIDSLPEAQRGTAIKELSPASAANTVQLSAQATSIVIGAVETRQQIAMSGDGASQTGIAAGDEGRYSQLWGQILGGSAHRAGDSENDGFTSKSFGLTSGFDHLITPNLLGGVALSWVRSWTDGSNASNGSTNTLDSYQMTFYGTYHIDRLAIDGQIGAGWNHYDQQRTISFLGNTASADYDGQQYMARTRVGYDFSLGDTTLTPFAGLRWLGARTESYQETGAGAANNSVNSQNNSSVTHEVGARAEWSFDTPTGIVSPEVSAAWIHDYTDNTVDTTGQIGGTDYSIQTKGLESDGVRLGIGLSYQTYENLSLKLSYDGELRSGYQSQAATLRMNLDF
ncbi:autotransporter domain-containing protein [uncultured Thalassospira sp.]|uniref:autotransporter outer membrane beta-barrel domain-containing protein n=1 Tax=uncultured Thalassospira sp. TaxID=404382 RepID=UPI0030D8047E